ncbi:uracil-DNA glycosylase [Dehalogenimonas etheniformans]|uniref:Uracil-DNA glycosylase n=2 Tax=Dehalogenimonas etheniformans TaxID=1536648 RepID=A0A2P5P6C7_9CHLR|nr:uracil-DNA glycosylase [Dehalogenimonas etheniformans]PPD57856.1 uracil-DNA glycosylase [Dehalogenimonas etheniformans]QNT75492.2 uracil-DNA glycosylase [Dehalogenimonas etheniformans]
MTKQSRFDSLVKRAQICSKCPRMNGRRRVLGPSNGPLDAQVMFIAEAPGRLGAEKYGIPLFGDQTGRNFASFLESAEIDRTKVFITNAILCNPINQIGVNDTPTKAEIFNCSDFLRETIDILSPAFIVPLGRIALKALAVIEPHTVTLSSSVAEPINWRNCILLPLFHPSPRVFSQRSKCQQCVDYQVLGKITRNATTEIDNGK